MNKIDTLTIRDFDMTIRLLNVLKFHSITTLRQILDLTEADMKNMPQLGVKSLKELITLKDTLKNTYTNQNLKPIKIMKADKLLRKNKSVTERATEFVSSIKRNIQKDVLDALTTKLDTINDELFEKKDFSLETNINSGQAAMTRATCELRFKDIIDLEYRKELLEREIKIKTKSFNRYFSDKETVETETQT